MGKLYILSNISQPKGTFHCQSCSFTSLVSYLTTWCASPWLLQCHPSAKYRTSGFYNKNVTVLFMFVQQRATYSHYHCLWLKVQKYVKTKTWHLCNCWACQTKSMSIILQLPLFWHPVWDFLRAILSSSVSLFLLERCLKFGLCTLPCRRLQMQFPCKLRHTVCPCAGPAEPAPTPSSRGSALCPAHLQSRLSTQCIRRTSFDPHSFIINAGFMGPGLAF